MRFKSASFNYSTIVNDEIKNARILWRLIDICLTVKYGSDILILQKDMVC